MSMDIEKTKSLSFLEEKNELLSFLRELISPFEPKEGEWIKLEESDTGCIASTEIEGEWIKLEESDPRCITSTEATQLAQDITTKMMVAWEKQCEKDPDNYLKNAHKEGLN